MCRFHRSIFHLASVAARLALLGGGDFGGLLGIRRQGPEGWLVLPAMLLLVIAQFISELSILHVRIINWFPFFFSIRVGINQIADPTVDRGTFSCC